MKHYAALLSMFVVLAICHADASARTPSHNQDVLQSKTNNLSNSLSSLVSCVGEGNLAFPFRAAVFNTSGRINGLNKTSLYHSTAFINASKGEKIIVWNSTVKGYVCISTLPFNSKKSINAIIPVRFVRYVHYVSTVDSWLGNWSDGQDFITIKKHGNKLSLSGIGVYLPQKHYGFFGFNAVPKNNFVSNIKNLYWVRFNGKNKTEYVRNLKKITNKVELDMTQCAVAILKIYNNLFVDDSMACGQLNVQFAGTYHRIKSSLRLKALKKEMGYK